MTPKDPETGSRLLACRMMLDRREEEHLASHACLSCAGIRRRPEDVDDLRQTFAVDADRVLHSRAYTRYIDKTQVFYMVSNDHITHRVLHVQLVSKVARTIGRYLGLNQDLIEAIALGHDIGHPPFGHDGEKVLAGLCVAEGLPSFHHNIQSVQFLDRIERCGRGWNLTLQTLDGILCHDGEAHDRMLQPCPQKDFAEFDRQVAGKAVDPPTMARLPMTLEGCVVRLADTISYIGRDIEDAIELQLIDRGDIPPECRKLLGDTNGSIVYRLVEDLIVNSIRPDCYGPASDAVGFSAAIGEALQQLKIFNYERIYLNPLIKKELGRIEACYRQLFAFYLDDITRQQGQSVIFTEFLQRLDDSYRHEQPPAAMVRDFIAGMTDDYFLVQAELIGCEVPRKKQARQGF
jgi:dGTPase